MDVIQPEFNAFLNVMNKEHDFTRIMNEFQTLLIRLKKRLFLSNELIHGTLKSLLETCKQVTSTHVYHITENQFKEMSEKFNQEFYFLFQVWSALPDCFLLVARLDVNHWYSLQKTYSSSSSD